MFAFQRELVNNWSLNADWIQRWFNDATIDQNCYGLPCNTTASSAYIQNRAAHDFGADNLTGTGDDRDLTLFNVRPEFLGKDSIFHTNCGNNSPVSCTQRYKAFEISVNKRMSNRWQMQTSYVWSRLDGDLRARLHEPEQPAAVRRHGQRHQRSAARVQDPRQLPGALRHHRRRELPVAERSAASIAT